MIRCGHRGIGEGEIIGQSALGQEKFGMARSQSWRNVGALEDLVFNCFIPPIPEDVYQRPLKKVSVFRGVNLGFVDREQSCFNGCLSFALHSVVFDPENAQ